MSSSAIAVSDSSSAPSPLSFLATAASAAAQATTSLEVTQIDKLVQQRLNAQIAALQPPTDPAVASATQAQINQLNKTIGQISTASTQYGDNETVMSDLQTQLATMATAAQNGDATDFDNALAVANIDVSNLILVSPTAPFQPDQILPLKANGLGISPSAVYDLSTSAGQTAAANAVAAAQTVVGQAFQATTNNQILATDVSTALNTQLNALTSSQQQNQQANQLQIDSETAQLTQQAQDQEHLIELSLGNSQLLSNELNAIETPLVVTQTPFSELQAGVTETTTTAQQQSSSAILNLFA